MSSSDRPVWREPMVWLMLGLPAGCLLAIAWTLRTAVAPDATSVSRDQVARTAQVQTVDDAADRRAAQLGLQATLSRDEHRVWLQLSLPEPVPARLRLLAAHPTHADEDVEIWLQPGANDSWQAGRAAPEHAADWPDNARSWSLTLAPEDASWRIDGILPAGHTEAQLTPRFELPAGDPTPADPPLADHE